MGKKRNEKTAQVEEGAAFYGPPIAQLIQDPGFTLLSETPQGKTLL